MGHYTKRPKSHVKPFRSLCIHSQTLNLLKTGMKTVTLEKRETKRMKKHTQELVAEVPRGCSQVGITIGIGSTTTIWARSSALIPRRESNKAKQTRGKKFHKVAIKVISFQ
jgi:hypothetical protein